LTAAIAFIFVLSGLLWLAPLINDPMGVLFWRGGAYSDLLISHWPNAIFVRRSLIEWGQVPLWNPMILSGAPFAADPLSGLYYPPNWLAIVLNPGVAFNLLAWLHIAWGGLGMWKLGRTLGIRSGPAIVAGLAFAGMPKLIGHFGLGHVSLVFAVYWTPWVLLAFEKAVREMNGRRLASAALAGGALGMVFLIDPRWYLPSALLSGAFAVWRFAHSQIGSTGENADGAAAQDLGPSQHIIENRQGEISSAEKGDSGSQQSQALGEGPRKASNIRGEGASWTRAASSLVIAGLMSLAVAAILAVPLGEFVSLSTRANLSLAQSTALRLPPEHLLNALAPEYAGWPEWQIYAGVVVLFLALATLPSRAPGRWFWVGVVIFSLILALGDLTPIYGLMSALVPGFGQLRVPPRSLFISSFALAMLAGMGLDQMLKGRANLRQLRVIGAALAGISLVLGLSLLLRNLAALQSAAFFVSAALIGLAAIWTGISIRKRSLGSIVGWCLLIVLDLSLVNLSTVEVRPAPDLERVRAGPESGNPRAFSPSYSLPQPAAAVAGLELADGINPLQLASYSAYMSQATGFSEDEYSVTLPPFVDPGAKWAFKPDLALMGDLAISQIVSAYPIEHTDLEFERMEQGRYYYRNPHARPRAWIDGGGPVEVVERTPNRIVMRATGPGTLVASEIAYPGWEVTIDGATAPLDTYAGLLRAVELSSGEHEVEFAFRPNSLRAGALVTLIGLIVLASFWIRR
jgi:hypothetical protein